MRFTMRSSTGRRRRRRHLLHVAGLAAVTSVALLAATGVATQARPANGATAAGVPAGFETDMVDRYPLRNLGGSTRPALSQTGLLVAFESDSENLLPNDDDRNDANDIFVAHRGTGAIERVSVTSDDHGNNEEGNSDSVFPSIDWTGANVVYTSYASNLVPGDTNNAGDVFVRRTQFDTTRRVSVTSGGAQVHGDSSDAAISGNGQFVAFTSTASDLLPPGIDTNGKNDIFVADLTTRVVSRVSVSNDGSQANGGSFHAAISGDGRYVAFASDATNLVSSDSNGERDVFVRDRQAGTTTRVSVHSRGTQALGGDSEDPSIALRGDGYVVAFTSFATNLVGDGKDTNGVSDVYVQTSQQPRRTVRASVSDEGEQANADSSQSATSGASITSGGQYVAFRSKASNLVTDDFNGKDDVFRYNIITGDTERWSVKTGGGEGNAAGNDGASQPAIDKAGHKIAYTCDWSDLDPPDNSNTNNIFLTVDHGGT